MGIELKKQAAGIVLAKRNLTNPPPSRVGMCIDISGSMQDEYRDGIVQDIAERCLALAMRFDSDKQLDVWTFNNSYSYVGTVEEAQVDGYVRREILDNRSVDKWGGTDYAPVLRAVEKKFFNGGTFSMFKKTDNSPVFLMFITDGDNGDRGAFESVLKDFRSKNIYIQIIGIGDNGFGYVEKVANAEPNVGFCRIQNVRKLSDEAMMELLVQDEFVTWIKQF